MNFGENMNLLTHNRKYFSVCFWRHARQCLSPAVQWHLEQLAPALTNFRQAYQQVRLKLIADGGGLTHILPADGLDSAKEQLSKSI